jgi:hypothetical protein
MKGEYVPEETRPENNQKPLYTLLHPMGQLD